MLGQTGDVVDDDMLPRTEISPTSESSWKIRDRVSGVRLSREAITCLLVGSSISALPWAGEQGVVSASCSM